MPLTVTVTDARGRPARVPGLAAWVRRVAPPRASGALTLALVSDAHMRKLNHRYRAKDYATDVLSFCAAAPAVRATAADDGAPRYLGDVVIAQGVARRQAREHGHSLAVELRVLALHGLLHLLGYDHERDAGEMQRVEQRLRRKGGLPRGLIERA